MKNCPQCAGQCRFRVEIGRDRCSAQALKLLQIQKCRQKAACRSRDADRAERFENRYPWMHPRLRPVSGADLCGRQPHDYMRNCLGNDNGALSNNARRFRNCDNQLWRYWVPNQYSCNMHYRAAIRHANKSNNQNWAKVAQVRSPSAI